jgi:outer membrane receptor for ferrienterochelin and colicin
LNSLKIIFVLLFLFSYYINKSQNADSLNSNILQPSLKDIISLKPEVASETMVTIANLTETNVYDAPNIVSVITEEDIKTQGYRDLLDVLNTIPGVQIANDVQNGTSIGIRGLWAEEGKMLFMINGVVLNDMAYGSVILGHRFPLANIKRIEVIRGAGSSLYGGLAALGVINIITKNGQEINGHDLSFSAGLSNKKPSRVLTNYNYGGILLKGIELTVTGLINSGNRSNEELVLPDSTKTNFHDSSLVNNVHIFFTLKYKNLVFKELYEDYNFQSTYEPIASLCRTSITDISNTFKFKKISFTPFGNYKWQIPWNTQYGDPAIYDVQNIITKRLTLGFNSAYKSTNWLSFIVGSQYYNDNFRHHRKTLALKSGQYVQSINGYNAYAEATFSTKIVNINIGGRFDKYAYFKPIVLPRISFTKELKKWHYKLLYGQSYKIPPLQNMNLDVTGTLVPEQLTDIQAEVGFHSKFYDASITGFNTAINKVIVYGYDNQFNESYVNSGDVVVQGFEVENKIKIKKITIKSNYSNYQVVSSTTNEILVDTLDIKKGTLSFPKHKVVSVINYKINDKNSVALTYIFQSQKYSIERINSISDEYATISHPIAHNINIMYQRNGLFQKLLDVNIGVYNVLNTKNMYSYTLRQGYSPVVGMGRELFLSLKFNL